MDQILKQLGELLLGAIPTVVLLLIALRLVSLAGACPLQRVLAERHARTEGAVQKARADIAAAEARPPSTSRNYAMRAPPFTRPRRSPQAADQARARGDCRGAESSRGEGCGSTQRNPGGIGIGAGSAASGSRAPRDEIVNAFCGRPAWARVRCLAADS